VPDRIANQMRRRASKDHRSLLGQLMAILEETVVKERLITPSELLAELRAAALETSAEAVKFVRKDRDAHSSRFHLGMD